MIHLQLNPTKFGYPIESSQNNFERSWFKMHPGKTAADESTHLRRSNKNCSFNVLFANLLACIWCYFTLILSTRVPIRPIEQGLFEGLRYQKALGVCTCGQRQGDMCSILQSQQCCMLGFTAILTKAVCMHVCMCLRTRDIIVLCLKLAAQLKPYSHGPLMCTLCGILHDGFFQVKISLDMQRRMCRCGIE